MPPKEIIKLAEEAKLIWLTVPDLARRYRAFAAICPISKFCGFRPNSC